MKRKLVESLAPKKPRRKKEGYITTVQTAGDILILNVYHDGMLAGRHCINTVTGEYGQQDAATASWNRRKYGDLLGLDMRLYGYYFILDAQSRTVFACSAEEKMVQEAMRALGAQRCEKDTFALIDQAEREYVCEEREKREWNRRGRLRELMARLPEIPADMGSWIHAVSGGEEYAFYDKAAGAWNCTACGGQHKSKELTAKHNDYVLCPVCGKRVQAKRRGNGRIERHLRILLLQPVDERQSVMRHFDVKICWMSGGRKIKLDEAVRILLYRLSFRPKCTNRIYYNQNARFSPYSRSNPEFDDHGNSAQRQIAGKAYLYPGGIGEALAGTAWACWDRAFDRMAADGQRADYDRLMCAQDEKLLARLAELLQEGRFRCLLEDVSGKVSLWDGNYAGALNIKGNTMEEVFGIRDRQRIYRIRGMDGGEDMLEWMRYSEETGENIPQDVLVWLQENRIAPKDIGFLARKMSITQIRNYVERQRAESYPGKKVKKVLDQWADYLAICKTLGKDGDDLMIYRPRELKRRHDEAVEEVCRRQLLEKAAQDRELARQEAERMRQRFPGAEEVLAEIREKYEYAGKDYRILVPASLAEIVEEGRALHHCAGASDRYFDRIVQRETYLCFLRRAEQPEMPYYTIEVEPGGTIRQHRGMYDEEPEIEQIRPFLREWQKEIRKRITKQDRQYAQASAIKRQQNLEELRRKRNTRVLEGLMEDFMEVV